MKAEESYNPKLFYVDDSLRKAVDDLTDHHMRLLMKMREDRLKTLAAPLILKGYRFDELTIIELQRNILLGHPLEFTVEVQKPRNLFILCLRRAWRRVCPYHSEILNNG